MDNRDILLASMIGSKAVERIPRLATVQNELMKHVLPTDTRKLPFTNTDKIEKSLSDQYHELTWVANQQDVYSQFFPLRIKRAGTSDSWRTLPYEPLISISGKNNIVKRSVAKAPNFIGTIKEHWSQDDYEITITGTLFGENEIGSYQEAYPIEWFERLRDYCTSPTGLEVECDLFQMLSIKNIVVESFNFPFTKGENVQMYDIKAVSDFSAEFLLELD